MPLSCWRKTHSRNINSVLNNVCTVLLLSFKEILYNSLTLITLNNHNFVYGGPFEIKLTQSKIALKNGLLNTSPINGTKLYEASNGR